MLKGRYRLGRMLGRGGMGEVFLAEDVVLGRQVAVKRILRSALDQETATQRLLREARSAARMHHPNIVTVYDVLFEDEATYIVMEYVEAENLADRLARYGPFPMPAAAKTGGQIAGALAHAHRLGIVHRDVKPSNILLEADGRALLTDFGIAHLEGDPGLTRSGQVLGSVAYMAPEVAKGDEASAASDVFSLGATIFALVEGHAPFQRNGEPSTTVAMLVRIATETAPLSAHAGALAPVIGRMLSPRPEDRPTAEESHVLLDSLARERDRPGVTLRESVLDDPPTRLRTSGVASAETVAPEPSDKTVHRPAPSSAVRTQAGGDDARSGRVRRSALVVGVVLLAAALIGGIAVWSRGNEAQSASVASAAGATVEPASPGASPTVAQAPLSYTCWNGASVSALKSCSHPAGRDALRYVYPSMDAVWSDCVVVKMRTTTQSYECHYGSRGLLRYRYWESGTESRKYYDKTYAAGSRSVLVLDGHEVGVLYRLNALVDGVSRMCGYWLDARFSFCVDASSQTARDALFPELQLRAYDQLRGHPAGSPAEVGVLEG